MLELNKQKHSTTPAPSELDRLEREVVATDPEIDELVYELYGIMGYPRDLFALLRRARQMGSKE